MNVDLSVYVCVKEIELVVQNCVGINTISKIFRIEKLKLPSLLIGAEIIIDVVWIREKYTQYLFSWHVRNDQPNQPIEI